MLPKKYRLKNSAAVSATYKNHNVISDENVCIYLGRKKCAVNKPAAGLNCSMPVQSETLFYTRFAFVVSKKIHKRAVKRNRIKRLMRETVRLALKNGELSGMHEYLSIIFLAKQGSVHASFDAIKSSIYKLMENVLNRQPAPSNRSRRDFC